MRTPRYLSQELQLLTGVVGVGLFFDIQEVYFGREVSRPPSLGFAAIDSASLLKDGTVKHRRESPRYSRLVTTSILAPFSAAVPDPLMISTGC